MQTDLVHFIDYSELTKIFVEEFSLTHFNFFDKVKIGFDDHWTNDTLHVLDGKDAHIYTNEEVDKLMRGENVWHTGFHDGNLNHFDADSIIATLRHRGELPNDNINYLIRISW